ncbi:MAG: serine/threonine protein kinase [Trueperaceae bacterium]|nr:serine/threonine protein kinase [Trueperaceae bacterium]
MTGRVPPGYNVIQRLGAGRTALVWLAQEEATGRQVALKIPRPDLATDPVLRRMFENEVQITLKLDHPNVVRAFSGRTTGDEAFLALEYCPGGTLDQLLLERGRLPLEKALGLVLDVAQGLAHTHDARVLHRDVKPANVFVDGEGRAKLGDFGTGTFKGDDAEERVGTAFYMAPEVFEGRPTSLRSDVYSLGVLAYEVLTGERPFVGASYEALMVAHLHSLPRELRQVRKEVPVKVAQVVARALARDPDRRFAEAAAFVAAYREAMGLASVESSVAPAPLATLGRGGARRPTQGDAPAGAGEPRGGGRSGGRAKSAEDDAAGAKDEPARARRGWWPFGRRR